MPKYAILRFEKHKGHPAAPLEAHHERQKEKYASNPDIDTERTKYNFHIVKPQGRYYHFIKKRIEEAGCRTRKDSTRFVDTLITASPEFFNSKSTKETKEFFQRAGEFQRLPRNFPGVLQKNVLPVPSLPDTTLLPANLIQMDRKKQFLQSSVFSLFRLHSGQNPPNAPGFYREKSLRAYYVSMHIKNLHLKYSGQDRKIISAQLIFHIRAHLSNHIFSRLAAPLKF